MLLYFWFIVIMVIIVLHRPVCVSSGILRHAA